MLVSEFDIIRNLRSSHPDSYVSREYERIVQSILQENILIPLMKVDNTDTYNDGMSKEGFRLLDSKLIIGRDVAAYMGMDIGNADRVISAHMVGTMAVEDMHPMDIVTTSHIERYNKLLNMTFMVTDEEVRNLCYDGYTKADITNIAKKQTQDCSVTELLYSIQQKLNTEKKL
jgi:hypothetical protein